MHYVPVVDLDQKPLMPMHPARARKLIKTGEATPFWNHGIWMVRLNREPSNRYKQDITVGIDPGSKKEGFTVKSKAHTYKNIQADAHRKVGLHRDQCKNKKTGKTFYQERDGKIQNRAELRRTRRGRNCRRRQQRNNRLKNKKRMPPGTRARWHWKLRILDFLKKIYPINGCVVEDIAAITLEGKRRWNQAFSPLSVGKKWFYREVQKRVKHFETFKGYETKEMRDRLGLKKSSNKLSSDFSAHCVDSFVLANEMVGGDIIDNTEVFCIMPLIFERRNLHKEKPHKKPNPEGIRKNYGGTMTAGFKKGTLIKHEKHGLAIIRGSQKSPIKKDSDRRVFNIQVLSSLERETGIRRETFKQLKKLNFLPKI